MCQGFIKQYAGSSQYSALGAERLPACEGAVWTVVECVRPQLSGMSCCCCALRQHWAVKLTIPTANPTTMTPRKRTHVEVPNIQLPCVSPAAVALTAQLPPTALLYCAISGLGVPVAKGSV